MQLVGDVGGSNVRLALADDGRLVASSARRSSGADVAGLEALIATFLADAGGPAITAACIAVAGPVANGRASLTNRTWQVSEDDLARVTGARRVLLINDLAALGHATASLTPRVLRSASDDRPHNGQALVVGAGTGFNVCAVRALPGGGVLPLEAEEGHTALPLTIARRLTDLLGADATEAFPSVEHLFAGRGLARFHALRSGVAPVPGEAIAAAANAGDAAAVETLSQYAEAFGLMLREVALRFMPREGIWLAGSVARTLVPRTDRIAAGMLGNPLMRDIPLSTPLLLIEDDMAALQGCIGAITP
ncbi:glucokinase [Paracoccus suum]|uniref:Glucokinase n=1 Tax=Paracoccus suum TaxID=2259340 RepID=A0A344PHP0_9RHOB|nr:glucokinase [Paracoccus suum]AXC48895.1 glucokinase [Paracoccus suum]